MNKLISGLRFFAGYLQMVRDPHRLDVVFRLIDGLREADAAGGFADFIAQPKIRALMEDTSPVLHLRLEELRALPEGSLGRVYATHYPDKQLTTARGAKLSPLHERLDTAYGARPQVEFRLVMDVETVLLQRLLQFAGDHSGRAWLPAITRIAPTMKSAWFGAQGVR